jgi:hypothetical protein
MKVLQATALATDEETIAPTMDYLRVFRGRIEHAAN